MSGLSLHVHPLALLGIADHYTRDQQQFNHTRVAGAVFGYQEGNDLHAVEVMGITIKPNTPTMELDFQSFVTEMDIYKKAYPLELLGWYTTGSGPVPGDAELHDLFLSYVEQPLFFVFNPSHTSASASTSTVETETDSIVAATGLHVYVRSAGSSASAASASAASPAAPAAGAPAASASPASFSPHLFSVFQDEPERIAILHTSESIAGRADAAKSPFAAVVGRVTIAASTLSAKFALIADFLDAVAAGTVTADPALVARAVAVVARADVDLLSPHTAVLTPFEAVVVGSRKAGQTAMSDNANRASTGAVTGGVSLSAEAGAEVGLALAYSVNALAARAAAVLASVGTLPADAALAGGGGGVGGRGGAAAKTVGDREIFPLSAPFRVSSVAAAGLGPGAVLGLGLGHGRGHGHGRAGPDGRMGMAMGMERPGMVMGRPGAGAGAVPYRPSAHGPPHGAAPGDLNYGDDDDGNGGGGGASNEEQAAFHGMMQMQGGGGGGDYEDDEEEYGLPVQHWD